MNTRKGNLSGRKKKLKSPRPRIKRLDGVRHWRKTQDRSIWLLLHAGIQPEQIRLAVEASLHRHRKVKALLMPSRQTLEYSRIITEWRTDPAYLDRYGHPVVLRFSDRRVGFRALVRKALPEANAKEALSVLTRHQVIRCHADGRIELIAKSLVPQGELQAQALAYILYAIEALVDTSYANLKSRDPRAKVVQFQQLAISEKFDLQYLPDYDKFLQESGERFIFENEDWLKRHEIKKPRAHRGRIGYVGVAVSGVRAL